MDNISIETLPTLPSIVCYFYWLFYLTTTSFLWHSHVWMQDGSKPPLCPSLRGEKLLYLLVLASSWHMIPWKIPPVFVQYTIQQMVAVWTIFYPPKGCILETRHCNQKKRYRHCNQIRYRHSYQKKWYRHCNKWYKHCIRRRGIDTVIRSDTGTV